MLALLAYFGADYPVESRSMLIVYWLGDRKLINAYLTKNSLQNINLPKEFLKILIDVL